MNHNVIQRVIIVCLLFLTTGSIAVAQERHALLTGIGQYPKESGWPTIHGDNDVVIINRLLLEQGFKKDNITVITNSFATKSLIMEALNELRLKADEGDVVYIHFSGHGQQVTDLDGDEPDDHFDEAWIPFDARKYYERGVYEGQNHILDDELNNYLNGLRSKVGAKGRIVLVADACHSGSGSRGLSDEEEFVRGTSEPFIIPGGGSNVIKKEAPVYWLYVGACKPHQINYEHKSSNGTYYGSLSYVIANADSNLVTSDYRDIINQWKAALIKITRYPQDLDDEGRPSRRSNLMF